MTTKRALITGVTGQDGSYLAEFLLQKGYDVYGIVRRSSSANTGRLESLYGDALGGKMQLTLLYGDLTDGASLFQIVQEVEPDEIYNLGAQSHVRISFDVPEYTADAVFMGTLRLLQALRKLGKKVKFYQASSSEMFGRVLEIPQSEKTPFNPRSPYAIAKVAAHYLTINYREAYGLFACSGILFNHESPCRGTTFVTRKISRGAARIKLGLQEKLRLGNLDAKRDWGFAGDYVEGMWLMLQQDEPDDYILATGEARSVREFLDRAFTLVDLDWHDYVEVDPHFFRPTEVEFLLGDSTKAREKLGWKPKVGFDRLVEMMVKADLEYESGMLRKPSKVESEYLAKLHEQD